MNTDMTCGRNRLRQPLDRHGERARRRRRYRSPEFRRRSARATVDFRPSAPTRMSPCALEPSAKCSVTPASVSVNPVARRLSWITSGFELARGRRQQFVQVGAMKLDIGRTVLALVLGRQRELLDHFAGIMQPEHIGAGAHAERRDLCIEPEIAQHVHGVGAHLDACTNLRERRRLLVHLDVEPGLHQTGCSGEPAKARTHDQHLLVRHQSRSPPRPKTREPIGISNATCAIGLDACPPSGVDLTFATHPTAGS